MERSGAFNPEMVDAIAIAHKVEEQALEKWGFGDDEVVVQAFNSIAGRWWNVGVQHGHLVWRKEGEDLLFVYLFKLTLFYAFVCIPICTCIYIYIYVCMYMYIVFIYYFI